MLAELKVPQRRVIEFKGMVSGWGRGTLGAEESGALGIARGGARGA